MMLHSLHYDVACYTPGHKWHPGALKEGFHFTALTPRGLELLRTAPCGVFKAGSLNVTCEDAATDIMDHIEVLEVYLAH